MPHSCPNAHLLASVPTRRWLVPPLLLWFLLSPCLLQQNHSAELKAFPASQDHSSVMVSSPAVPTASSPRSARELQRWNQWPRSTVHQTSSPKPPKPFRWGPPPKVYLSHTVSLVSGRLPLTTGVKTKYKGLNEKEMPCNLHLSLLPPTTNLSLFLMLPKYIHQQLANTML